MIQILARDWFGELKANFDNEAKLVEQMAGCFMMELPELSSVGRGRIEDVKAFVSGTQTTVRLAWARRPMTFKRQCVFLGSTNDFEFLIDNTGNRRWWPLLVKVDYIDTAKLRANVNAIWGAAVAIYREMRAAQPEGPLNLSLSPEAEALATEIQDSVRVQTESDKYAADMAYWLNKKIETDDFLTGKSGKPTSFHREWVCVPEVRKEALDLPEKSGGAHESTHITNALRKNGWVPLTNPKGVSMSKRHAVYDVQKAFVPGMELKLRWIAEDEEEERNKLV